MVSGNDVGRASFGEFLEESECHEDTFWGELDFGVQDISGNHHDFFLFPGGIELVIKFLKYFLILPMPRKQTDVDIGNVKDQHSFFFYKWLFSKNFIL